MPATAATTQLMTTTQIEVQSTVDKEDDALCIKSGKSKQAVATTPLTSTRSVENDNDFTGRCDDFTSVNDAFTGGKDAGFSFAPCPACAPPDHHWQPQKCPEFHPNARTLVPRLHVRQSENTFDHDKLVRSLMKDNQNICTPCHAIASKSTVPGKRLLGTNQTPSSQIECCRAALIVDSDSAGRFDCHHCCC
jgi:hypothetical protein